MHIRVRSSDHPDSIIVVDSKLTKIDQLRRLIRDKFSVDPKCQRLFYGGKLLEDGYTFHDYNIKLNDVIQLMVRAQPLNVTPKKEIKVQCHNDLQEDSDIIHEDAESNLYAVGDLVDVRDTEQGAWYEGKIVRIVYDPEYTRNIKSEAQGSSFDMEDSQNKPPQLSSNSTTDEIVNKTPPKKKGIAEYFSKLSKNTKRKSNSSTTESQCKEVGVLYKVLLEAESENREPEYNYCKINELRPRSRTIIDVKDLKVGQKVLINYNLETHHEKGSWFDFKISEIKKLRTTYDLIGTLYFGPDGIPQNDTKVRVLDKIYAIEELVPLAKRSEELKKLMITPTDKRSSPLNCFTCRDEDVPCRDCGCFTCLGKDAPDKIILCDECNHGYHMHCLSPPLSELPEEDWYCPMCKRDPNTVVAPGAAKQARKEHTANGKRDWGRGMACVGKTKTCAMPANHFGPIPGIEVGMCWRFRIQLSETGVHRPPVSGIHGRDVEGAYSIVLSGGYEDDYDNGIEFTYTGSGGRDLSGNKRTAEQSCDQTLTRENKALARNCAAGAVSEAGGDAGKKWRDGKPVRVVRSYKMLKHFPQYAPKEGIRYDGIYKVVKYYPEKGKSGFRVWKYLLRRDDPNPAPWEDGAKQYPIIYPDGYLEAQEEKKKRQSKGKAGGGGKRRAATEACSDSEVDEEPAAKRARARTSPRKSTRQSQNKSLTESPKGSTKTPNIFAAAAKKAQKDEESKSRDINDILTNQEIEAINADTANSKLWKECFEVATKSGKKEFVDHVTQIFKCIICQDVVVNPVTTPCAHNFCSGCLKLAFKCTGNQSCAACRRELDRTALAANELLRAALRTVMPGYDAGK